MECAHGIYTRVLATASSNGKDRDVLSSFRRMYAYSLWFGEAHTPLTRVLTALTHIDVFFVPDMMKCVYTPAQLREKFQHLRQLDFVALQQSPCVHTDDYDTRAFRSALNWGPMQEAIRTEEKEPASRAFMAAVHCREVQLQLLIVAWLLPHVPKVPSTHARYDTSSYSKRRKHSKPKSWHAPHIPFADVAMERLPTTNEPKELSIEMTYDSLRALYEALADQLCLLQFSATLTPCAWVFGSGARVKTMQDERDEAQWFCADVFGSTYASSLPKEYEILRLKCFGPGLTETTPTRRRRMERTSSAPLASMPVEPSSARESTSVSGSVHENHPILDAERSSQRRLLTTLRSTNEVHMTRRLVRTHSYTPQSTTLHSPMSTPTATAPSTSMRHHKRKAPANRWASVPAKTLVMETPRHVRQRTVSFPSVAGGLLDKTQHDRAINGSNTNTHANDVDDEDDSLPPSPSTARITTRTSSVPDLISRPPTPDSDSDVDLLIPETQKAARKRDPLALFY